MARGTGAKTKIKLCSAKLAEFCLRLVCILGEEKEGGTIPICSNIFNCLINSPREVFSNQWNV